MPLDYDSKERERWRQNVDDVPRAVKAGELETKIRNYCDRFGFDRQMVLDELSRSEMFRAWFAKAPNTQNFHEKEAATFISEIDGVSNFQNLPSRALAVSNGAVIAKEELTRLGGSSSAKSIDFTWEYGGATFYASHKFTRQSGGSQDQAYQELKRFILEASTSTLQDTYFVAIADGNFYQQSDSQANKARIERLRDLAGTPVVHACTINELEKLMKKLVDKR